MIYLILILKYERTMRMFLHILLHFTFTICMYIRVYFYIGWMYLFVHARVCIYAWVMSLYKVG